MESTKLITVNVDEELSHLLENIKKDYCINLSGLVRKLLIDELSNTNKYNGGNLNVSE